MNPDLVEAGKKKYMGVSCNGCHGGNGGGGMCPPLSNETWVYGADDDTLFRLVALGSDELMKQGYTRKGRENVVGPMPAHGKLVKTEDDMWRIIYFIRGNFRGEAKNIKW
jgi:mono/diheme cytochrome c family protein